MSRPDPIPRRAGPHRPTARAPAHRLADLIAGAPVLPTAGPLNSWLATVGIALTAVYATGVVARPARCRARLGPDSLPAALVFGLGIAALFVVAH
jgi:cation:H+ antiporter